MLGGAKIVFAQKGNACGVGGGDAVFGVNQRVEDGCIHGFQIWRELRHVNGSWMSSAATREGQRDAASTGGTQQLPPGDRGARTYHQTVASRFSISSAGRV